MLRNRNPDACERNLSPQRGGTCSNCGRTVWPFGGVTPMLKLSSSLIFAAATL